MINSYKEGDIWTERGKTWTIKNGIKRTVTKTSSTRKKLLTPLCCPKCSKSLSHWLDQKMYTYNGFCHDCTIDFEHTLIKEGLYEDYQKNRVMSNATSFIGDLESYMKDFISESSNTSNITEDGDVEAWIGDSNKRLEELSAPLIEDAKQQLNNIQNERGI